jgi:hypothetical protein
MLIILAILEAEVRRIVVRSQPGQIVCKTLSQKALHKNRAGGVAQGEGPEFKPQYHHQKKKKKEIVGDFYFLIYRCPYFNLSSMIINCLQSVKIIYISYIKNHSCTCSKPCA